MLKFTSIPLTAWLIAVAFFGAGCVAPQDRTDETIDVASKVRLSAVMAARSDELKARDTNRHPAATLKFFGIKPGMKIAEVLPGGGWYTQILAPYVGREGAIYGINYADNLWSMFGYLDEELIASRIASADKFSEQVASYKGAAGVTAKGYAFGRIDPALNGKLDAVLMIRALHNLYRFEEKSGTLTAALQQVAALLKTGGILGVVQHRAPADADETWANGSNGYLKQAAVVAAFEQAGFELVASSEINANPKDKPVVGDSVWRLPPSLRTAEDNKAAMLAIGETDRMTLKFRKP